VAPLLKLAHVGVVLAVIHGWEDGDLTIVPEVSDGLSYGLISANGRRVVGGAIDSDILAITTSTRSPELSRQLHFIKVEKLTGHEHTCSYQRL
jgi:hypothetical protein